MRRDHTVESERLTRKLAAILYADVAEYSRLMGEDEDGTHRRLSAYLDHISASILQHQGRIEHYAGDAVLADFDTVLDALTCAASIQRDLDARNSALPDDRKVRFRIGVNLGDIIVDRDDIYGEGVNVAARLEGLAKPGGICISESVHTAVGKKLPLDYEFIGEQRVKNIAQPVRAYHAHLRADGELPTPVAVQTPTTGEPRLFNYRYLTIAVFVLLIAGAGLLTWLSPWERAEAPDVAEGTTHPLPNKPSVVVLPFDNMSGDTEQDYFADGMTEDLITDLSKIGGLFVIARNSSFTYKDKPTNVQQVARELGVRYVLEGSVRRSGDQVRINAQLIDASTGGHIWADRYDGKLNDVFGLQDKVTRNIVTVLAVQLTAGDEERFSIRQTENTQAYDEYLQGWNRYIRMTPDDVRMAVSHFEKAIELDPDYPRAYAALAATYWQIWKRAWHRKFGFRRWHDARSRAEEFLEKALQNPTPLAHQVASRMLLHNQRHGEAIAEAERAVALDPNDADSYVAVAMALSFTGLPREALPMVERAMRLNPHYPPSYLYALGLAHFGMDRFEEAALSLEKATALNPDDRWSRILLVATYGQLGRGGQAAQALEKLQSQYFLDLDTIRSVTFWHPFKKPTDAARFADGLRKAGMPD
jgi:TolB-like protein/class 3 adenylate cyclase/Flp pilus assembly protein TadD